MWRERGASQPLVLIPGSVALECKQVCKVAGEGLGREPAARHLFCSKCLAPEEDPGLVNTLPAGRRGFELGFEFV